MSALVPPPPDVASAAGTQLVPFHFKTCPTEGTVVAVSTSDSELIDMALTSEL